MFWQFKLGKYAVPTGSLNLSISSRVGVVACTLNPFIGAVALLLTHFTLRDEDHGSLSTASFLIITCLLFDSLQFSRSQCPSGQGSNLAANGAARQSTSASNATPAQKAIDGDTWAAESQTKREAFPFWEVVLRSISNISQITIFIDQLLPDCSSYSVLFYDDACRLKGASKPVIFLRELLEFRVDYSVNYTRSVAIRCSNTSSSLLPRLTLNEVVICGSETNGGAASRLTTFCSGTSFSVYRRMNFCLIALT
ncbi:uncharacterized protein [Oscarella lobularis]|uniref:uncharacterized protein isoform X2 n=1 Tax=Oscarella lobularis TaxID=121494 RepID=UPI0033142301